MTQSKPFSGKFFNPRMGLAIVDPLAKFNERRPIASSISEIFKENLNLKSGHVTYTTPVSGRIFPMGKMWHTFAMFNRLIEVGLAIVDAFAKFKERSFIHSRNINGGLKF